MSDYDKAMLTTVATLTSTVVSVIGAALVARWVAKSNVTLEKVRAMYRAEIDERLQEAKIASDRKLEELRHELRREAVVHEVKFRKLYDRVAEVVEKTFELLTLAYASGGAFVSPIDSDGVSKEDKFKKFADAFNGLCKYIFDYRIFLPKRLHDVVNQFLDPLKKTAEDFHWGMKAESRGEDVPRRWSEASNAFNKTIMPLYENLCREMQAFIGLEDEPGDKECKNPTPA